MQLRDRTDSESMEVDRQLSMLEERKFYLEGQLAQMKPNSHDDICQRGAHSGCR